jgi:hypothetical protein
MLEIFAVKHRALSLDGCCHYQGVVPTKAVSSAQPQSFQKQTLGCVHAQERSKNSSEILLSLRWFHGALKPFQRDIQKLLDDLVTDDRVLGSGRQARLLDQVVIGAECLHLSYDSSVR